MGGLCKEKGRIDGFRVEVCGLIDVLEVTVADCKAFFFCYSDHSGMAR